MAHLRTSTHRRAHPPCGGTTTTHRRRITGRIVRRRDRRAPHHHVLCSPSTACTRATWYATSRRNPHSRMAQLVTWHLVRARDRVQRPTVPRPAGARHRRLGGDDRRVLRRVVRPAALTARSQLLTVGTPVTFDESIDKDLTRLDGGGGIDTLALPATRTTAARWSSVAVRRVNNISKSRTRLGC